MSNLECLLKISFCLFSLTCAVSANAGRDLYSRFKNPDNECRTKLWWFHGETETTKEGIRKDLEEFKEKGIGGVVFYDQVHGKAEDACLSKSSEWWQMLKYAALTAKELDLTFEVAAGNGYVTGGPWITPDLAMKKTVFVDTLVKFDKTSKFEMPNKIKDFQDIATIVFADTENLSPIKLEINPIELLPGDSIVFIDLGKRETIRGISYTITPRGKGSTASMNIPGIPSPRYFGAKYVEYPPVGYLEISSDNVNWTKCCDLLPIENTIGFKSRQRTISFPKASGRYVRFRLHEDHIDDPSYRTITISDFSLHRRDVIDNIEVKTGLRTEVFYPSESGADYGAISLKDIVDVSDSIDNNGCLSITLPAGVYRIVRFGYVPTGAKTKHGRKNLIGYEADVMSAQAANIHYDNYFKEILDTLTSIGCRPKGMCMDSHEAGCQNWTRDLEKIFKARRGYDILPYIATMAGYIVESRDDSEKVLRDFRRTVAETISSEYYGTLSKRCSDDGVDFTSQSMLNILADNISNRSNSSKPQGEFWAYQKEGNYDCLDAASAAHIYGHNIASGEAFTDTPYDEPFDSLLRIANIAYSRGINEFAVCASSYQPWLDHKYDDSASSHPYVYHRFHPLWESSRSFWDYQARCATLLREGTPVVDLAVYIGEEPPLKTFAYKLPEIPIGYNFDVFTIDALLNRFGADNGEVIVNGGMRYKAIIVQDRTYISELANNKLKDLEQAGVPVIWCNNGDSVEEILVKKGIMPDVNATNKLHFFHRKIGKTDIYFIYNHSQQTIEEIALRDVNSPSVVEIWNPKDGSRKEFDYHNKRLTLKLNPWESAFIVSRNPEYNIDNSVF